MPPESWTNKYWQPSLFDEVHPPTKHVTQQEEPNDVCIWCGKEVNKNEIDLHEDDCAP